MASPFWPCCSGSLSCSRWWRLRLSHLDVAALAVVGQPGLAVSAMGDTANGKKLASRPVRFLSSRLGRTPMPALWPAA